MPRIEVCPVNPSEHSHGELDYLAINVENNTTGGVRFQLKQISEEPKPGYHVSDVPCMYREAIASANGVRARTNQCAGCKKVLRVRKV